MRYLLLQLGFGFGECVDFVFLTLEVIQCLLMGLLKSFLLLGQLSDDFIQCCHFLSEVFNLSKKAIGSINTPNTSFMYNAEKAIRGITANLVLSGMFLFLHFGRMFLFLHFGQSELKIINVLLELRAFILQLSFLCNQLCIHLLFILQSLSQLLDFGLKLDLALDQTLTSLLSIYKIILLLSK